MASGICDGASGADLVIEYSDDPSLAWNDGGHTWNDVKDVVGTLDVTAGDREVGSKRTFGGNIKAGVTGPGLLNINLDVVFENDANSFLEFLTDTFDGTDDKCYWLRWTYDAGASGALRRTAKVVLLTNPYTGGSADDPAPVSKNLTHVVDDGIYRDAVP